MEKEQKPAVTARVKLTLHAEERFFGPGICELLEKIREKGSIQAAAAEMNMSYTKAWRIVNRAEKEMGAALITRISGGRNGGSSTLTGAGERAVYAFRKMEAELAGTAGGLLRAYRDAFRPAAPEAKAAALTAPIVDPAAAPIAASTADPPADPAAAPVPAAGETDSREEGKGTS